MDQNKNHWNKRQARIAKAKTSIKNKSTRHQPEPMFYPDLDIRTRLLHYNYSDLSAMW